MAFGSTPVDLNNIPIGSTYVPNSALRVLRGGREYTDGSSNISASAAMTLEDGWKSSYVGTMPAQAVVAGDIFQMTGSSTKTIKLTRILLSAASGTAATAEFRLVRRSTADSAGTPVSITILPLDSNNAAATGAITGYSAAPTQGTLVGAARSGYMPGPVTAGAAEPILEWKFGDTASQAPTLRGSSQFFALVASAGATVSLVVEWTEE